MSFGFIVKKNTEAGGLLSTGSATPIFPKGARWVDSETGNVYEYLHNSSGGAHVAGQVVSKYYSSTAGDNPCTVDCADAANYYVLRIAMSAAVSSYWSWYLVSGRYETADVDLGAGAGTASVTAGQEVILKDNALEGRTAAVTDMDAIGIVITTSNTTYIDMYFFGGDHYMLANT